MKALLLTAALALQACTSIGHQKADGWPALEIREHYLPHAEMRDRCVKYAPWGSWPEACAEFNLAAGTCDIFYSADFPPPAAFIAHERLHCQGYDHEGETHMADFLVQFNRAVGVASRQ